MEIENLAQEARTWKVIYPLYINKAFARSKGITLLQNLTQKLCFLKIFCSHKNSEI